MNRRHVITLGMLLALFSVVNHGVVRAESGDAPDAHALIEEYSGPETCAKCHLTAAHEVVASVHYQLQESILYQDELLAGAAGGMSVSYCKAMATVAGINWLMLLQPQDELLPAQPAGCGLCHPGLGAQPNWPSTDLDLQNVDCLICHGPDYERTVAAGEDGSLQYVPAEGVDSLEAARGARRPTNEMCSRCHQSGAGCCGIGDFPVSAGVDVHAAAGLHCVDCHPTNDHQIAGGGQSVAQELQQVIVACSNCHLDPHQGGASALLDQHAKTIACQTCHVPAIARDAAFPAEARQDFTRPVLDSQTGLFGPSRSYESNLVPTYLWWDHTSTLPKPGAGKGDTGAMVYPWMPLLVVAPYDSASGVALPIKQDVYAIEGNLDAAVRAGAEASGQPYSGSWVPDAGFVYFSVNHQVAPAAEALQCAECHSTNGRLAFLALGYSKSEAAVLGAITQPSTRLVEETRATAGMTADSLTSEACLACHGTPGMTMELPNGDLLYLSIDPATFANSVHGKLGYACVQCHTHITGYPHEPIRAESRREFNLQSYDHCVDCHQDKYELELDGVHQKELAAGNRDAALCTDCHGAHTVMPPEEIAGRGSQMCELCHSQIYALYQDSVHGAELFQTGNVDVPSCTDCHGVHSIEGPHNNVTFHLLSHEKCAECHSDPVLMSRYGLNADVYDTYVADFHGTTVLLYEALLPDEETNKPVCVDCHGVHDILPAVDPNSHVMKENLLATCQRCHPDATVDFPASWLSHYRPDREKAPVVYYVDLFYKVMIPAVIGGMLMFNATDIYRKLLDRIHGVQEARHER